jgi:hypothetical protein
MAAVHTKHTFISLNGSDLSSFCNTSEFGRKADKHDLTPYGVDDHKYAGGLGDGSFSIGGHYDDAATGPRDVIEPLIGTNVTAIRRVEGTGSGKPQDSVEVLVEEYVESSPVAGFVAWSATLQPSGPVTSSNQA